jgi:hypothetical protein
MVLRLPALFRIGGIIIDGIRYPRDLVSDLILDVDESSLHSRACRVAASQAHLMPGNSQSGQCPCKRVAFKGHEIETYEIEGHFWRVGPFPSLVSRGLITEHEHKIRTLLRLRLRQDEQHFPEHTISRTTHNRLGPRHNFVRKIANLSSAEPRPLGPSPL